MRAEELKRSIMSATLLAMSALSLSAPTCLEVTGHISDATGAAVAGAKVSLANLSTNAVRIAVSTDSGDYTFPAVAPGVYNIRVEQRAFKTIGSNNIQVQVQQTVRLDFSLEVGRVTESISVLASADLLQTENASAGTVVGNKSVTELPLNDGSGLSQGWIRSGVVATTGRWGCNRQIAGRC